MSASFGKRLRQAVEANGPIVAGIDPHSSLLREWGVPDTAEGARIMSEAMLEAATGRVAAIKPQSAFFERFGSAGIAVLEELLGAARERGILTILDVKRGDIGSTMGAYAEAYLRPGSPLEADAITVSPYLGFGALAPCLTFVKEAGKGIFVLALTSNSDGPEVQHARGADGTAVAARMAVHAAGFNASHAPEGEWGSVGLVVGATVKDAVCDLNLDLASGSTPILAPGFGAQGAGPAELKSVFGSAAGAVLVSMSRSILTAGSDPVRLAAAIDAARGEYSPPSR